MRKVKPYTHVLPKNKPNSSQHMDSISVDKYGNRINKFYDEAYPVNVLEIPRDNMVRDKSLHPTQKPVALFEYLIQTYSDAGDFILDNCAGSGTTAIAALNLSRNYICMEKNEEYYSIAIKRIDTHKTLLQPSSDNAKKYKSNPITTGNDPMKFFSDDGKEFATLKECRAHERTLEGSFDISGLVGLDEKAILGCLKRETPEDKALGELFEKFARRVCEIRMGQGDLKRKGKVSSAAFASAAEDAAKQESETPMAEDQPLLISDADETETTTSNHETAARGGRGGRHGRHAA